MGFFCCGFGILLLRFWDSSAEVLDFFAAVLDFAAKVLDFAAVAVLGASGTVLGVCCCLLLGCCCLKQLLIVGFLKCPFDRVDDYPWL